MILLELDLPFLRIGLSGIAQWQRRRNPPEQLRHVVPDLGAGLHEHHVQLLRLPRAFACVHLSAVDEVGLVAHQDHDDVLSSLVPHLLHPPGVSEKRSINGQNILLCVR